MIIHGQPADAEILRVQKSIANNLKNKNSFQSTNKDTADNTIELKPPVPMNDCLFVFTESSYVAKCSRILSQDILYSDITLTPDEIDDPDENLINQVIKINKFLNKNIDELFFAGIDYYYAGWCAVEYTWNNTSFKLKQIPIHSCKVVRANVNGNEVYLLKQQINSKTNYFKIMGETYPKDFMYFNGQKVSNASLMGGDNIYAFYSLPRWIQNYKKILTEIAITSNDYKTVSNGNISSGVLNINMEPQPLKPIQFDENNVPIPVTSREEVITEELQSANGGTAVIFTESNRPLNMDYVKLSNDNQSHLTELRNDCEQSVLNDYNIPLVRLMINTEKESMNSDKTKSIWEVYLNNLKNEHKPFKKFIRELIFDLYSISVEVNISTPIFSDRREIEINNLCKVWENGGITLKQYVTGLSDYIPVIDLNDYDFTVNPDVWNYRNIQGLNEVMSDDDLALIEAAEAELNALTGA